MRTAEEICSQALVSLGAEPIDSLAGTSTMALICQNIYPNCFYSLLAANDWSFAKKSIQSVGQIVPEYCYYSHQLPIDFLRIIDVYDKSSSRCTFQIQGQNLKVKSDEIQISYVGKVNEYELSEYFIAALAAKLAAQLCLPVTEDPVRARFLFDQAEAAEKRAFAIDSQQATPAVIEDFNLIRVRF